MYLKYIEIYGFKSFANRTKIEFFPGINVVVGPNGSGKSNIVDAIKWCIGEMSSKSLRMPSMMDVIFAGTTRRQQMNFAEVSLVFDNSQRKLNFDFNEVGITRKIYRSEESEYFINKVPCRLRDIREMFLDTGIGSNGYAIIDQGEIEDILLANPQERREVFEEVSGISKYKAKRDETIKKLEKVEIDLSIVENSIGMIEEQIKKLDLEAKRARLQQKYKEELREAEVAYNVKLINNLNIDLEKERELLSPVVSEINNINVDINQISSEITTKDLLLNDKIIEERELEEKISNLKSDIVRVEGNIVKDEGLIDEILKQLEDLEVRNSKDIEDEKKLLPLLELKKKRKEELGTLVNQSKEKYEIEKTEYENVLNKISQIDMKVKEIESQSTLSYQNEINISNLIARTESEISHLNEDILNLKRELSKNEIEYNNLNAEVEKVKKSIELTMKEVSDIEKQLLENDEKKRTSQNKLEELEKKLSDLSMEKVSLETKLETMLKDASKDTYWVGTEEILKANIDGVYGLLRNLIKFPSSDRVSIEDALSKSLDSIVVKDMETAFKCIAYLKNAGKGRARFLVLSNVPLSSDLKSDFPVKISCDLVFSNLISFLLSRVSIKDDNVISDVWIAGGVSEVSSNEPYWYETTEIKNRLNDIDNLFKELSNEKNKLEQEISEVDIRMKEDNVKREAKNIELSNLNNELDNLNEKIKIITQNIDYLKGVILDNENKKSEISNLLEKYNLEINNIRNKSILNKDELEKIKAERYSLEKELMERKEKVVSLQHTLTSLNKENENIDREIEEITERLNNIMSEKQSYAGKKDELQKRVNELKNEVNSLKIKHEELINDKREIEIKRTEVLKEIDDVKNEMMRLNSILKENNDVLKEQIEKRQEIELRINTISTKIEDIVYKLSNEYQISYDEVKDRYRDFDVNQERIEYLKKRIENMGNVNMTAPEEYEALVKEYNEKKRQIDDLNKAKEDLRLAINRINQMTRENFKNTFEKVSEYFQKIYLTLFEGGEARLVLTDPENLLETGVEILARPPGKKLINISQLSGGEKSLTALALLFSFFCVNPSPFCVMDEVDAALDEANVERFVRLLKEFAPTTQFIIITHNKRTMEAADRLYGVTMEELGVSRIIAVDLKRAINLSEKVEA